MRALPTALLSIIMSLSFSTAPASAGNEAVDFSLIDHEGKPFQLRDQRGRVVLVFFGYTLCPDVCPIELAHMATAIKRLGSDSARVRGLFVTVDPEHDTPEVLSRYVSFFDSALVGLTGSKEQIAAAAKQFRVVYRKNTRSSSQYTLDHTANLFVIDRHGKLSTIVPFGFPATHIENLLREMLATDG